MKYALTLALALVAASAMADGVPLLSPGRADQARVNTNALDANVITVNLDGKDYRFVGRKTTQTMVGEVHGKRIQHTIDTWTGAGPTRPGNVATEQLTLVREGKAVSGTVFANNKTYTLRDGMLVQGGNP